MALGYTRQGVLSFRGQTARKVRFAASSGRLDLRILVSGKLAFPELLLIDTLSV